MQPYTPQTVKYIASASGSLTPEQIARYLGWPIDQVERIARKHEIKLAVATKPHEMVCTAPEREPSRVCGHAGISIDLDTDLDDIIKSLPLRQSQFLTILEREIGGRLIPSTEIAERCGNTAHSVGSVAASVRSKLRSSRWTIESKSWRGGGGYRLVVRT